MNEYVNSHHWAAVVFFGSMLLIIGLGFKWRIKARLSRWLYKGAYQRIENPTGKFNMKIARFSKAMDIFLGRIFMAAGTVIIFYGFVLFFCPELWVGR